MMLLGFVYGELWWETCDIFVVGKFSMWFELYCKICQVQSKKQKKERKHQKKERKKKEKRKEKSKDAIYVFLALGEIILVFYGYGYYLRALLLYDGVDKG